jgi:hypothetical protein
LTSAPILPVFAERKIKDHRGDPSEVQELQVVRWRAPRHAGLKNGRVSGDMLDRFLYGLELLTRKTQCVLQNWEHKFE